VIEARKALLAFGTFVNMRSWLVLLTPLLLFPLFTSAQAPVQDTILTMSGREFPCIILDSLGLEIRYEFVNQRSKTKTRILDRGEIFSIRSGEENVLYQQDTLIGNWMTEAQVRDFIAGEMDARACHKAGKQFWISFAISAGAAYAAQGGFATTILAPLILTGWQLVPVLRIQEECISDPSHTWNEFYALGYEKVARPMQLLNALKGGGSGMALGIILFYLAPL